LNAREGRKGDVDETKTEREIQRKLRVLMHAAQISDVSNACRYF
jgi:hypothetical protein